MDIREHNQHLAKAVENLACAELEFVAGRYNTCASRAYYAAYHAAICGLISAEERPPGGRWSHQFVLGRFGGVLVYRRKLYSTELRRILQELFVIRRVADYASRPVSRREAAAALGGAQAVVEAVKGVA